MKKILPLFAAFVFCSYISGFSQNQTNSKKDSISLSKYLHKLGKEVLTKESIEKNKKSEPLKTSIIIYGEQIILTTAKND